MSFEAAQEITQSLNFTVDKDIVNLSELKVDEIIDKTKAATNVRQRFSLTDNDYKEIRGLASEYVRNGITKPGLYENYKQTLYNRLKPTKEFEDFVENLEGEFTPIADSPWARTQADIMADMDIEAWKEYTKDIGGKTDKVSRKQYEKAIKEIIGNIDPAFAKLLTTLNNTDQLEFFGFSYKNVFKLKDPKTGIQKGLSVKNDVDAVGILNLIKKRSEKTPSTDKLWEKLTKDLSTKIDINNIKLIDVVNHHGGTIPKAINTIQNSSSKNKIQEIKKLRQKIVNANKVNEILFTYIVAKAAKSNQSESAVTRAGMFRVMKGTQNSVKSFHRMFSKFRHVELIDGVSQAPDNKKHPYYKQAKKWTNEQNKENKGKRGFPKTVDYILSPYLEHLYENKDMLNITWDLIKNKKSDTQIIEEMNRELLQYDSSLNSGLTTNDMDRVQKVMYIKGNKLSLIHI